MVFLLLVVSLLLTLGGGAAALYGADMIRSESGSTIAISGVAMVCAGLLMFALTACLAELRKIRRLVEAGDMVPAASHAPFPVAPAAAVAAPAAAAVAAAVVAADRAPAAPPPVPPVPPPVPEVPVPETAAAAIAAADEPGEPDRFAPADRESWPAPEREDGGSGWDPERPAHDPSRSAHRPPEDDAGEAREEESAQPSRLETTAGDEAAHGPDAAHPQHVDEAVSTEPDGHQPAPLALPAERTLVATYTSGENTYFMYSDGAIEAETSNGRFRFGSMDELRDFVETGTGGMPLAPPAPPRGA